MWPSPSSSPSVSSVYRSTPGAYTRAGACSGVTASGAPCRATPNGTTGFCVFHAPAPPKPRPTPRAPTTCTADACPPDASGYCRAIKADGTRCGCFKFLVEGFCDSHAHFRTVPPPTCRGVMSLGLRCRASQYLVDGFCPSHKQYRSAEATAALEVRKAVRAARSGGGGAGAGAASGGDAVAAAWADVVYRWGDAYASGLVATPPPLPPRATAPAPTPTAMSISRVAVTTSRAASGGGVRAAARPVAAERECTLCLEPLTAQTALVPCGHASFCASCAARLVGYACPMCRAAVRSTMRVYV